MKRFAFPLVALLLAGAALWWLLGSTPPTTPHTDGPPEVAPETSSGPEFLQGQHAGKATITRDTRPVPRVAQILRGRVERNDGTPIPGATIVAALVDPQRLRGAPFADGPPLGTTTSDNDGTFELETPRYRYLTVTASAAGFATQSERVASRAVFARIRLSRAGALRVRVLDENGEPVGGATAEVLAAGTRHRGTSDAAGLVSFDALAPGTARLQAWADGYTTVVAPTIRVVVGQTAHVAIALPRSARITGTVVARDSDAPIAGASVWVSRPGTSLDAGTTDAEGRFEPATAGGAGERQFLSVEAEGFAPALHPFIVHAFGDGTPQTVVVPLVPAAPWRGRVLAPNGSPAVDVKVGFTADGVADRLPQETRTDEGGWFTLPPPRPPVPGRRLVLAAESPAGRAARVFRPGAVAPSPLVLQLVSDASVFGRIRDRDGAPLAGAQVRLLPFFDRGTRANTQEPSLARRAHANETGFSLWSTATDEDGAWRIDEVAPGTYRMQIRASAHVVWRPETLDVETSDVNAGVYQLSAGSELAGFVRSTDGEPLAGARVRLIADTKDFRPASVQTREDGSYVFEDMPAGTYRLEASLQGFFMTEPIPIAIGEFDEQVDVALRAAAQIELQVDDAQGRPFEGVVQVRLHQPGRVRPSQPPHIVELKKGRGHVKGLQPGAFNVEARAPGLVALSSAPESLALGVTTQVYLRATPTGALRGRVVTQAGAASAGARVHLVGQNSGLRLLATTDADGRFQLDALRPEPYALTANGPGGAPAKDHVEIESGKDAELKILLRPAGSIDIRVLDASGRGVPNVRLAFRSVTGLVRGGQPAQSGSGGRLRRDGLPVGPITVQARSEDGHVGSAQVNVAPDRTSTAVIRLKAPEADDE